MCAARLADHHTTSNTTLHLYSSPCSVTVMPLHWHSVLEGNKCDSWNSFSELLHLIVIWKLSQKQSRVRQFSRHCPSSGLFGLRSCRSCQLAAPCDESVRLFFFLFFFLWHLQTPAAYTKYMSWLWSGGNVMQPIRFQPPEPSRRAFAACAQKKRLLKTWVRQKFLAA